MNQGIVSGLGMLAARCWPSSFTASGTDTYSIAIPASHIAELRPPDSMDDLLGVPILVAFTNANTGAATLNVNGFGAKPVKKGSATALAAGDLPAGAEAWVVWDGTNFQVIGTLPTRPAGSASELQYRASAAVFGAISGSSVVGSAVTLGSLSLTTPLSIGSGGTGQVTAGAAFNALSPLTTQGDIIYRNATTNTRLAAGSAGAVLQSGGAGANPAWSTATYPATTTANQLLYSSSANVIAGLATANNGVLITSGAGVPSISSTLPTAVQDNITRLGTITTGVWNGTTIAIANGGTGNTTATAAFNALSPMTTLGDTIYGDAGGAATRLAGDTSNTRKFLREQASGGVATAPVWDTLAAGDIPSSLHPAGSGSELQCRSDGNTFAALSGSSISGSDLNLAGFLQVDGYFYTNRADTDSQHVFLTSGVAKASIGITSGAMHFYNYTLAAVCGYILTTGVIQGLYGFDANSQKITNVATCTVSTDAANKGYVDSTFVVISSPSVKAIDDPTGHKPTHKNTVTPVAVMSLINQTLQQGMTFF